MQEAEIVMLEESFAEVAAVREQAAELFYERLFVHDPSLRAMFSNTDMKEQGRKLMAALSLVVISLRKLDSVVPALEMLAVKHGGYGVRDEHYATVGKALIETLSLFMDLRLRNSCQRHDGRGQYQQFARAVAPFALSSRTDSKREYRRSIADENTGWILNGNRPAGNWPERFVLHRQLLIGRPLML
jgi:hemoglobin-like flavoprotein